MKKQRKQPPVNLIDNGTLKIYSGHIIVRLSREIPAIECEEIFELFKNEKLELQHEVFRKHKLSKTRRVIRSCNVKELEELENRARRSKYRPLNSLANYWRIDVNDQIENLHELVKILQNVPGIEHAYAEYNVSDPAVNAANDTYAATQTYLDAAPTGIDARWAWTQPNSEGAGINFVDLEQGWFLNHEDLVGQSPTLLYGTNRDGFGSYKGNHGTAVMGQVAGVDNALGIIGITPSVSSANATSHFDGVSNLHVADAIIGAIPSLNPGDVLLLEVQRAPGPHPTEIDDADFDAIRLATALGIIVIEAAGNGDQDLDTWNPGGLFILDRSRPEFRDSRAIMVGASVSAVPHERISFSNYGSRIDCYGWGEDIVTAGYGDLDDGGGDDNRTYTSDFGGTSGASPMVTGAAILLQGMYEANTGGRLSPAQMRELLSNPATGTPQGGTVAGNIGVMPDLRGIIQNTLGLIPDVYMRDNIGDTGAVPSSGSVSASPDIIVRKSSVADPTALFGEGSGNENSPTLGFEVEAGQDNFLYVRMKNRGTLDARNVVVDLYWSEVSTLVTPDMWNFIGTTSPLTVPQGDTLAVAGPVTWSSADIPGTGHYCFVGIAHHPADPAPVIPPATADFTFNHFIDFVKNNNNVAWRNFNVVDEVLSLGRFVDFPFQIVGAPDDWHIFDFELEARFPRGVELQLELPLVLARNFAQEQNLELEVLKNRKTARLLLPALPKLEFCNIKIPKKARFKAKLRVKAKKGMNLSGNQMAVKQRYQGEEVGRVTWKFQKHKECK